jgi:hypothetical protein
MANHLTQATINTGGRVDSQSKMYGGMSFTGNTEATTIAQADTWYPIGTGNASHTLYTEILDGDPYWILGGDETADQYLQFARLDGSTPVESGPEGVWLTVHWGASITAAAAAVLSLRLVKLTNSGSAVGVDVQTTSVSVANFPSSSRYTTIVQVNPLDKFYIELQNNTGAAANVTVQSAEVIFTQ